MTPTCSCRIGDATAWLIDMSLLALTGDRDAIRVLPSVLRHWWRTLWREVAR